MRTRIIISLVLVWILGLPGHSEAAPALVQKAEVVSDNAATIVLPTGSDVTSGNVITIEVSRWTSAVNDPIVVGDIAKSAGTATIGSFVLDRTVQNTTNAAAIFSVAIFSAPVTGTGSLSVTVSGNAGNYWWGDVSEWSGISATSEAVNSAAGTGTAADSGNAASAAAGLFVAVAGTNQAAAKTYIEDGAFTLLNEEENGGAHQTGASAYRIVASNTTDSGTWTLESSIDWGVAVVVFPVSGGAAVIRSGMLLGVGP